MTTITLENITYKKLFRELKKVKDRNITILCSREDFDKFDKEMTTFTRQDKRDYLWEKDLTFNTVKNGK